MANELRVRRAQRERRATADPPSPQRAVTPYIVAFLGHRHLYTLDKCAIHELYRHLLAWAELVGTNFVREAPADPGWA